MFFIVFVWFILGALVMINLVRASIKKDLNKLNNIKSINRPCPPFPHKWEQKQILNKYGEKVWTTRCLNCKRKAGEID